MKTLLLAISSSLVLHVCFAAAPSFRTESVPDGWKIVRGEVDAGALRSAKPTVPLELATSAPVALPMDATVRFRAAQGDVVTFSLLDELPELAPGKRVKDPKAVKALLISAFRPTAPTAAAVTAHAGGEAMSTEIPSLRGYNAVRKHTGALTYSWRFAKVKNLWDESDRKEIGAAYAKLVPLEEKTFVLRFSITPTSRQIWLDDRLVAEARMSSPKQAFLSLLLTKGAQVLSCDIKSTATDTNERFVPLALAHYSHAKNAQAASDDSVPRTFGAVPVRIPQNPRVDINLGDSLYRYRATNGGGPEAHYVNAQHAWPGAFDIDPASLTFRVPYRTYQNAWLLAWVDETPNTVPKGAFRFFRENAGYTAATDFEITEEAIARGLVQRLPDKTGDGKQLYLVRVPVNSADFYGFRDTEGDYLEFELTKPLALGRSYPDPIYYGYHPAGLPSSIHVVGITLEEAPFTYEVKPKQTAFVFEQPEVPSISVPVTNTSNQTLAIRVSVSTRSYDETETFSLNHTMAIQPGATEEAQFPLELKRLGWHELNVLVETREGRSETRQNQLSLVLLPPNTRTYGDAPNEVRFGMWHLLGHYTPLAPNEPRNADYAAMFRKLGLRKMHTGGTWIPEDIAKKYDLLPVGPHTVINVVYRWKEGDLEGQKKMIEAEVAAAERLCQLARSPSYFYGGEWHIGRMAQYAPWPFYTGDGDRDLSDEERQNAEHQIPIFTQIGRAIHAKFPQVQRYLQWGAAIGTQAYWRAGIPKDVVDGYGMDAPMFELLPEASNATGSINTLWMLRQEAKRLGWPTLPIHWCEGPFFPTNPGALTEPDQMDYQMRYMLLGLGYGIDGFEAGVVPFDAGNYYGAEHYGAGVFHRVPLMNPKPAVAAIATMTSMLCGADRVGNVETGSLTTYCMEFQRAKDKAKIYALWRVRGKSVAQVKVSGQSAMLTDAMGNATKPPAINDAVLVPLSSSPVWLTGVEKIDGFTLGEPVYDSAPAKLTKPLADMTAALWSYDGSEDKAYAENHFSVRRIPDPKLTAEFGQGEPEHADAVAITLPVEPGDRPLATRYGALKLKKPIAIPGKASALGMWVRGNSSWGRVIYQLRDAKGELWTSSGTKDEWNCDDTHGWSSVNFEGWRYMRFPLPGNAPWDNARDLETTWWGARGGDGIVDLPLSVEKIIVEARNEVPWLGEMKLVPDRSYKLSHLVAEYEGEQLATPAVLAKSKLRMPLPVWTGPTENTLAKLNAEGVRAAPELREFTEPTHFNDGRRMTIHFDEAPDLKYNLYLSIYPDGRGADLVKAGVKNEQVVTGLRPEIPLYLFLTSVGADKKESKPSKLIKLITHDNFAEK
jgi:hypothetical protein